jgi:FemAB family
VWEAIKWARANGYRWFDFGGIREIAASILDDGQSELSGLFKVGFGGAVFRYPLPVKIISSPLVRGGYDLALRWPAGAAYLRGPPIRCDRPVSGGGDDGQVK